MFALWVNANAACHHLRSAISKNRILLYFTSHHFLWCVNCTSSTANSSLGRSVTALLAARHCDSIFLRERGSCDGPLLVYLQMTAAQTKEA